MRSIEYLCLLRLSMLFISMLILLIVEYQWFNECGIFLIGLLNIRYLSIFENSVADTQQIGIFLMTYKSTVILN